MIPGVSVNRPLQLGPVIGQPHSLRDVSHANTHMPPVPAVGSHVSTVQASESSHARGVGAGSQPNSGVQISAPLQKSPSSQSSAVSQGMGA
ncbi:MAG: hypothetical protein M5U28_28430 [Sandaracinaceae bacterium]|nr:hypothetical protein [Sandaracinaceae bacterium]